MRADTTRRDSAARTTDEALRRRVGARLGLFGASALGMTLTWTVVAALRSPAARWPAAIALAIDLTALAALWRVSRAPRPWRPREAAFATCVVLGLSSIGRFGAAGLPGELLAFALFTLYLLAGVVFAWGWRLELALFGVTLLPFSIARGWLDLSLSPIQLDAAVIIGTAVAVGMAEGSARSFRLAFERRQGEETARGALAASRDAYRNMTESARDAIWEADCEGRLTYINEAGARVLDATPAELIGTNVDAFVSDHPQNPSPATIRADLAAGTQLPPRLTQWTTPHGPVWMEVVADTIRGPGGELHGFRGISRDVTRRIEAEARVRQSEARYRGVVDSQEALIFRCDREGNLRFLNDACKRKYGVESVPAARLNYLTFVHPDDAPHALSALRALRPGTRFRRQSRGRTPEGWRWIEWDVSAITDERGLAESLRALAAGMCTTSTRVVVTFPTVIPRFGEEAEVAAYRVAQEALTNAVRHAGAETITLTMTVRAGRLRLEVHDDGCGFDYELRQPTSLGLATMEERATALRGTLRTTSTPGKGTTVRLECPVTIASPQSAA